MKRMLRLAAIAIASAAAIDPAIARRVPVPLPVQIFMPAASDPQADRAAQIRDEITARLGDRVAVGGGEEPQAFIALGRAPRPPSTAIPLFGLSLAQAPSVDIETVAAPTAIAGQSAPVVVTLRAAGLAGRTTTVALVRHGSRIESAEHLWTKDDESAVVTLEFVPTGAGVHRVRVVATTEGSAPRANADLAVVVRERRLRILAYEARPSWALTFARRSLEGDPLFDVTTLVRTTSRSATTTVGAPASLATLQANRFDAVLVGAPEVLSAAEIGALEAFVVTRGGALLLFPDRRLADNIRSALGLPAFDEVIVDRPLTTTGPAPTLRTSELLLAPRGGGGLLALSLVRHGSEDRIVVGSLTRGAGRIIVSGALDAWRYRADPEVAFDNFWRGLVADAAATAPPPVTIDVEPSVARPGDALLVSVSLRPSEFDDRAQPIEIPAVTAQLASRDGTAQVMRLWPGAAPGRFQARTRAPRPGHYSASVRVGSASADVPLLIADDVVHAVPRSSRALSFAASASGGEMAATVDELVSRLAAVQPRELEQRTRPMRSPWWIIPFAGVLCAEWALRRRAGQR